MRQERYSNGRVKAYPWDRWFARRRNTLKRGRDYDCQPHSMMIQVRNQASRRGLSVSVFLKDEVLTVINHEVE